MSVFNRFWKFLSRESRQNDDQKKAAQAYENYIRRAGDSLKAEQKIARDLRKD
jgi:cytochrome c-type biogenesis protein CcmH/NrfG